MFGYIRPAPPELKVKEYEFYRSAYCGLCRTMGHCTGCVSRMTLSYDFVFLALIRASLDGTQITVSNKRCFVHPTSKRLTANNCAAFEYCAYANALLTYHNLRDKISDGRGIKKMFAHTLVPPAAMMRKAALNTAGFAELDCFISEKLSELSELENQNCPSADRAAQVFGELLSVVFALGYTDGIKNRIAQEIGLHIGRWIYLVDAADDYCEDTKSGAYNPFAASGTPPSETLVTALNMELAGAANAVELIDFPDKGIENIVKNIIYLGLCSDKLINEKIFKNNSVSAENQKTLQGEGADDESLPK